MGMKPYVIRQGDYLKKLGHRLGFDADAVWNDPANAELKKSRGGGSILKAGDILQIPDEPRPKFPFKLEEENKYVAQVPKTKVQLKLNLNGIALKDEPYKLEGADDDTDKTATGDGTAEFEVPVYVREVVVALTKRNVKFRAQIGNMDPITTPSGIRLRLKNLGFGGVLKQGAEAYEAHNDQALKSAVKAFQAFKGLKATGDIDDATRSAIEKAHGS
jgi:hypothetical protein